MRRMKSKRYLTAGTIILSILFMLSIACKQSGEIITPAEATQRYEATQAVASGAATGDAEGAEFPAGSEATLTGVSYLVGIYSNAGDTNAISFATRGDLVIVQGSIDLDGEIWYRVETDAGDGWLSEDSLMAVE